jgi:hypothetical protein
MLLLNSAKNLVVRVDMSVEMIVTSQLSPQEVTQQTLENMQPIFGDAINKISRGGRVQIVKAGVVGEVPDFPQT